MNVTKITLYYEIILLIKQTSRVYKQEYMKRKASTQVKLISVSISRAIRYWKYVFPI